MNTMTGKEVLRAIADGADPSEFEASRNNIFWGPLAELRIQEIVGRVDCYFRRKPLTRVVNGFTVPAPIQEMPDTDEHCWCADVFTPDFCSPVFFSYTNFRHKAAYDRGLLFSTKEAAIANAKAMCGIDPNGDA